MNAVKTKIYSLKELINVLDKNNTVIDYLNTFSKIHFGFKEIEHLCFWDPDYYSKININKGDDYELVLICWEKGQHSAIHNHEVKEAWTYILKGELTEEIYSRIDGSDEFKLENTVKLPERKISSLKKDSRKVHRLINSYDGRSVSLHLYKK